MPSHPYISGVGNITDMLQNLRRSFPATITSETVKKYGLAPNNESYVINALQFLGLIDEDGNRTESGHNAFLLGDDEFTKEFEKLVKESYSELFELHGDEAWSLPKKNLVNYFRTSDKTSEVIGGRQASVFQAFASMAGHDVQAPVRRKQSNSADAPKRPNKSKIKPETTKAPIKETSRPEKQSNTDMALTVRIEINLPSDGTKETYDNIFKSIRENLIQ
jgi:hypothetical protein